MSRNPKFVILCCLPLAVPVLMAGYAAALLEFEAAGREAARRGDVEAIPGVEKSQDYVWNSSQFQRAANELIASGRCKASDFEAQGGFVRVHGETARYVISCPSSGSEPAVVQLTGGGRYRLDG